MGFGKLQVHENVKAARFDLLQTEILLTLAVAFTNFLVTLEVLSFIVEKTVMMSERPRK